VLGVAGAEDGRVGRRARPELVDCGDDARLDPGRSGDRQRTGPAAELRIQDEEGKAAEVIPGGLLR